MLSEKLAAFENAFDTLNRIYFENKLSKSVVTIYPTPGAYGHFSCAKVWERGSERYHEINLAAADIARPLTDVIATLVHEMVNGKTGASSGRHREEFGRQRGGRRRKA